MVWNVHAKQDQGWPLGFSAKGSGHGRLYCRKDNGRTGVCISPRRLWRLFEVGVFQERPAWQGAPCSFLPKEPDRIGQMSLWQTGERKRCVEDDGIMEV